MAGSLNKVTLIGNLGKDPDIRNLPSGEKVANLSLATSDSWKDRNTGERKERTEWHNVTIFNENLTRVAENYLRKGSKIYIEGALQTRKWQDKNGQDRYTTEVVLQKYRGELVMLDSKGDSGGYSQASYSQPQQVDNYNGGNSNNNNNSFNEELDDEIPF